MLEYLGFFFGFALREFLQSDWDQIFRINLGFPETAHLPLP